MKGEIKERTKANLKLIFESVAQKVEKGEPVKNTTLIVICQSKSIKLVSNETESHLIHELWKTPINLFIAKKFNQADLNSSESQIQTLNRLTDFLKRSPPQSWREAEQQILLQQFCTPLTISFFNVLSVKSGVK